MHASISSRESPLPREDHIMNINRIATSEAASSGTLSPSPSSIFSAPAVSSSSHILATASTLAFSSRHLDSPTSIDNADSNEISGLEDVSKDTTQPAALPPSISTSNMPQLLTSTSGHRRISQFQVQSPSSPTVQLSQTLGSNLRLSTPPKPLSLGEFLYQKGFLDGISSDVTIKCFGHEYHLHKLILSRSSFFATLVSAEWTDKSPDTTHAKTQVHEVDFCDDENVTRQAFEFALARLYGHEDPAKEKAHITGLLAVATFLDMPDIIEYCVSEIVKSVGSNNVASLLHFSSKYEYGEASRLIVESCKTFLYIEGYDLPRDVWADIPNDVAAEVVAADGFYVSTEWDRAQFLVLLYRHKVNRILSSKGGKANGRRLTKSQAEDLQPLRDALNYKVHYCHLTYTQLEMLENLRDHRGQLLIRRESLRNALWLQTGLRHKVVNASVNQEDLGLARSFVSKNRKGKGKNRSKYNADVEFTETPGNTEYGTTSSTLKFQPESSEEYGAADGQKEGMEGKFCTDDELDSNSSLESDGEEDAFESSDDDDGVLTYYPIPSDDFDDKEVLDPQDYESKSGLSSSMTRFPPFRFSVKFDDVSKLKVEKRVYSNTYWYAGSYWNVYIQRVQHKKGHQLGVYLHRGKLDANAQSNNSRLDQRLSLFGLNDIDSLSPQLTTAHASSPTQRRSQSLFFDTHTTDIFNIGTPSNTTRNTTEIAGFDSWELPNESESSLLDTGAPWTEQANLDNANGSNALSSHDITGGLNIHNTTTNNAYPGASLGLPPLNTSSTVRWSPPSPRFGGAALAAASIAVETANQGGSSNLSTPVHSATDGVSTITPSKKSGSTSVTQGVKPEYLDMRKGIQAYFEIYTPARRRGARLTCFSSSPDNFKFAQSWGWKSSTLCAVAEEPTKGGRHAGRDADSGSLKFMIVVGLV